MGNLTDDMTRLRGEVDALRSERGALVQALTRGSRDLADSVLHMRADLGASHSEMAKITKKNLSNFVSGFSKRVARMRHENAADLAGAGEAWAGSKK